ncbi:MAG TPA: hypothetical protein ENJ34_01265 [Epsilonproteobacteria bacterium]|nr:hypothetical protein [Campylobacterota bacterium]
MSTAYILWNIFLGALGFAYLIYGKKQRKAIPLFGGVGLMVLPYFTSEWYFYVLGVFVVIVSSYIIKI